MINNSALKYRAQYLLAMKILLMYGLAKLPGETRQP
jgi:hypothetical protein